MRKIVGFMKINYLIPMLIICIKIDGAAKSVSELKGFWENVAKTEAPKANPFETNAALFVQMKIDTEDEQGLINLQKGPTGAYPIAREMIQKALANIKAGQPAKTGIARIQVPKAQPAEEEEKPEIKEEQKKEDTAKQTSDLMQNALNRRDHDEAQNELKNGADINDALYRVVIFYKDADGARFLLDLGANPNAIVNGAPLLFSARPLGAKWDAYGEDLEYLPIAELLLERGADVNLPLHEYTPLLLAAARNNLNLVRLYLEKGADFMNPRLPEGEDHEGKTFLQLLENERNGENLRKIFDEFQQKSKETQKQIEKHTGLLTDLSKIATEYLYSTPEVKLEAVEEVE